MGSKTPIFFFVPDFIDLCGHDWKEIRRQTKKNHLYLQKLLYWLKIGLLIVFSMNLLNTIRKNHVLAIFISC